MRAKSFLVVLACFALLLPVGGKLSAQNKKQAGVRTVVIDAGHGGKDPGAVYGGVKEKDINLKVALLLGGLISKNHPDVKVVYTRKEDVAVGLAERGNIANKAGANLFISIHSDAAENKSARGSTTYIMGMDKQEKNLAEAMRENAVMKYEEDYTEKYEGFDPSSAESYIIFSLMQHADFDQSLLLAQSIQKQYKVATAMADRGAKQGPFYVLWKPAMPRVLTEMGFLSNEQDRRYLNSEKGRVALALALYTAFDEYKQAVEKTPTSSTGSAPTKPAPAQKPAPAKEPAKADTGVAFYVQLSASRGRISTDDKLFDGVGGKVIEKHVGGWYKYYLGGYSNLNDATDAKDKARISGFKEAYVIAMDGDTPITIDDARRRLGKK